VDAPLAFSLAALLLLLPALAAPLMRVSSYGALRTSWVPSVASGIWSDGFASLGVLVGAFGIALPAVFLCLLIWVLGRLHAGRPEGLGPPFRWVKRLRPWVMIEVYLVGCFVAYSRLKVVATVEVGLGGWLLIASTLALLLALTQLDERTVWEALTPRDDALARTGLACSVCDLIAASTERRRCARCGAILHARKPDSVRRTTALVLAGYILYVPANILPVLTIVKFGREDDNTILSGVFELIQNDLWPLALIVFAASIVLPLLKLFGLTWMLVATRRRSGAFLVGRTRFYRMIDVVGRWSNIDVFMVAVLVTMLQFGALTSVHAGNGLIAFAAVVIITMIAAEAFDSRLMWDACERRTHG
jgi:paraquat-inducible protein A